MPRVMMVIDLERCVGCMACVAACIRENIARYDGDRAVVPDEAVHYARTKPVYMGRDAGLPEETLTFVQCMHCDNPPCAMVCPTGATHKRRDGVVMLDTEKCIGCRACVVACPYGARTLYRGRLPGKAPHMHAFEPGYPDKCTMCVHRSDGGEWTPACVEACAFNARIFGYEGTPELDAVARDAVALFPFLGTRPRVLYRLPWR